MSIEALNSAELIVLLPPLSAMRAPREFKELVEATFINGTPDRDVMADVCLSRSDCPEGQDPAEWEQAIDGIRSFLVEFAERLLDDANLYNAIKHGLGVSAGAAMMLLGAHQVGHGPSIEYPEPGPWNDKRERQWALTTRWVDITKSLALTHVAIQMINSIWTIGRARYIGTDATGAEMFFPIEVRPHDFRSPTAAAMQRMSWTLAMETKAPRSPRA